MSDDLTCEWNAKSDDAQHEGEERCTDCLKEGHPTGLASACDAEAKRVEQSHCETCTCGEDGPRHDEGFVACRRHLGVLMTRYGIVAVPMVGDNKGVVRKGG